MVSEIKSPPAPATALPQRPAQARARPETAPPADTYTPSAPKTEPADYRGLLLQKQFGVRYDQVRDFVVNLLRSQGVETGAVEDMSQEEAQAAIAEDGYWGVEQTSERIFQFAIAAAGNDPANYEKIKAAVQDGYDQAKEAFGGWLPEISEQTLGRVFEKLDQWVEELAPPMNGPEEG